MTPGMLPGGFDFRSILGVGAGGWVALARQQSLDRDVAVKTVLIGKEAGSAVRRLDREAKVLAGLDHPGIVRVHQLIPAGTALFLVMEFVPGSSLDKISTTGSLTATQIIVVLGEVAAALTAVHAQGIAHRDIKPSNIMVHPTRGAVLLDFGLARLPAARSGFRSEIGTPTGTPLYMAPEQVTRPDEALAASDAYAFGVMAYELLLGHYPYEFATLAELLQAHKVDHAVDPRAYCEGLPLPAAVALVGAMAKDPGKRISPHELVRQLRRVPEQIWENSSGRARLDRVESVLASGTDCGDGAVTRVAAPVWSFSGTSAGTDPVPDRPVRSSTAAEPPGRQEAPAGGIPIPVADSGISVSWVAPVIFRPRRRLTGRVYLVVTIAALIGLSFGLLAVSVFRGW